MPKEDIRQPGVRRMSIALDPEMDFDRIVEVLKQQLTFEFPRGCAPCLSGLDRLIIDSVVFEQLQTQQHPHH